ncbi:MAG: hypothetical protein IIB38_15475 [Candidatus Hydrogenedentes bacterium]|nr:hypothetical protein [Candidatus Hydrogenedentota bacterium]
MASLDLTTPAAVTYLRDTLPLTIREISRESAEAVQAALLRGFEEGLPARKIAKQVKEVVGLTKSQGQAVANFRKQLETGEMIGKLPSDGVVSLDATWETWSLATKPAVVPALVLAGRQDKVVHQPVAIHLVVLHQADGFHAAAKPNPMQTYCLRLKNDGKTPMEALGALMRKLLVLVRAILISRKA